MSNEQPKTRDDVIKELNEDTARRGFVPFPKWLYHPDGRSQIVANEAEQTALGGEWLASPQEALDEKARRDERDSKKFVEKVGAEAAAKSGKPKN
jgi:hypothetical protein